MTIASSVKEGLTTLAKLWLAVAIVATGGAFSFPTAQAAIIDTTPPVITINGQNPVTITRGQKYVDDGATAIDETDGLRSVDKNDNVDEKKVGAYVVVYTAKDRSQNKATATRNVNVVADTVAPVITVKGANPATVYQGKSYTDAGATATDNVDGSLTSKIVKGGDTVNTSAAVGTVFTITYTVSDKDGNVATASRTVTIAADIEAPVITVTGGATVTAIQGRPYTDQGATATDNADGNLTSAIVVVNPVVTTADVGTEFTVTYNVADAAGNAALEKTRKVTIVEPPADQTAPVITLKGSNPVLVSTGQTYNDAGATAVDDVDGTMPASAIHVTNPVNTSVAGTYTVTYTATDAAGNVGTATRTVGVGADTTRPVITLLGSNPVVLTVGDGYNDAGAVAFDNVDGNLSANIVKTIPVDTNIAGTYLVRYNVKDKAGNNAVEVVRAVTVNAKSTSSSDSSNSSSSGSGSSSGTVAGSSTAKKGQVAGTTTSKISAADRKAPDFIANNRVVFVTTVLFKQVYGRAITPVESAYWKGRARSDKATVSKLRGAMNFQKARGYTVPPHKTVVAKAKVTAKAK